MDRFIARENIKHFLDRLWSESDPQARALLQKLLVEEEDKLGADLELLADLERHISDGNHRVERQRTLVEAMERDGHDGLPQAKILLAALLEGLRLHNDYHRQIQIEISKNRL